MRALKVFFVMAVLLAGPAALGGDGGSCPANKDLFADTNPKVLQSTVALEDEEVQSAQ